MPRGNYAKERQPPPVKPSLPKYQSSILQPGQPSQLSASQSKRASTILERISILSSSAGRMEDLDKDIVVFNDEEGNEIELEVVDYFDYENEEYAVMIDPAAVDDDERDLFVFRIQVNGEYEEFLPADEDKMDI